MNKLMITPQQVGELCAYIKVLYPEILEALLKANFSDTKLIKILTLLATE